MDTLTSFSDIFKSSFLEGFSSSLSVVTVATSLMTAFLLTVGLYFFYKFMTKSVMYSKSFNISMSCIALVTAVVIMAVRSNVVLSLGMVGALSIVRFRTAIKDPLDLLFLFWSVSIGIVTGAGNYYLAIAGSAFIAAAMLLYSVLPMAKKPYLFIVNCSSDEAVNTVMNQVKSNSKKYKVKSKSVSSDNIELTVQMSIKNPDDFINSKLVQTEGIKSAVLLSYDGEYIS